jgi:hypothetical protein
LLRFDYQFIQYVSFENLIEQKKKKYYEALLSGQKVDRFSNLIFKNISATDDFHPGKK